MRRQLSDLDREATADDGGRARAPPLTLKPRDTNIWVTALGRGPGPYEPFFLRSAQRFFIANDNRLLPSGVSPPRFLAFNADGRDVAMLVFLAVRGEFAPSNAAMARLSLSLSCFKSATILCKSKIHSFLLICQLNVACYFVLPQHFSRMSVGIAEKSNSSVSKLDSREIGGRRHTEQFR